MAQESSNKIRKQGLMFQEKITMMNKELEEKNVECQAMASKMASTEHR